MHSFFEHLFPLYGWPRTLHQKIVTYSCRLPSLIVESQKWMYSLEWHTLGMLHKNMHYEIVNCTAPKVNQLRLTTIPMNWTWTLPAATTHNAMSPNDETLPPAGNTLRTCPPWHRCIKNFMSRTSIALL